MPEIIFTATPYTIAKHVVVLLPADASIQLPSRGMVYIEGTVNGQSFSAPLEPDGRGSHWLKVDATLAKKGQLRAGAKATFAAHTSTTWQRPAVPPDLAAALTHSATATAVWDDITPAAQWEWIRWIRATNNPDTRRRHIEVAISKMNAGKRRPCCFNRNLCSDPAVSKSWQLILPQ